MNMHPRRCPASLCLLLAASFAALDAEASEPEARQTGIMIDCARPALPGQREVGELTGQANFSQVYVTRARLMAEVRRACQRPGITRVMLQPRTGTDTSGLAIRLPAH